MGAISTCTSSTAVAQVRLHAFLFFGGRSRTAGSCTTTLGQIQFERDLTHDGNVVRWKQCVWKCMLLCQVQIVPHVGECQIVRIYKHPIQSAIEQFRECCQWLIVGGHD